MKKLLKVIVTGIVLAGFMVGCGSTEPAKEESQMTTSGLYNVLVEVNPIDNPREIDEYSMETSFGIPVSELVEEYQGSISNTMTDSGLNLVIKAVDGKAEAVEALLETYKANQEVYFENYPEFADAVKNVSEGIIISEGDYVVISFASIDGASTEAIEQALNDALN